MGNVHDCCICIVEPAGTVGATTVCVVYEGICNLGASSTFPDSLVMCTWAVGHTEAIFPDLSIDLHWHKGYC